MTQECCQCPLNGLPCCCGVADCDGSDQVRDDYATAEDYASVDPDPYDQDNDFEADR